MIQLFRRYAGSIQAVTYCGRREASTMLLSIETFFFRGSDQLTIFNDRSCCVAMVSVDSQDIQRATLRKIESRDPTLDSVPAYFCRGPWSCCNLRLCAAFVRPPLGYATGLRFVDCPGDPDDLGNPVPQYYQLPHAGQGRLSLSKQPALV
jgi:hypothetical protein